MLETAAQDGAMTWELGQECNRKVQKVPGTQMQPPDSICASTHPGLGGEGCELIAKGLTRTDASMSKPAHVSVVTTVAINKQGLFFFSPLSE